MKNEQTKQEEKRAFKNKIPGKGLSRRSFFKYMGAGIATYFVWTDYLTSGILTTNEDSFPASDQLSSWIHLSASGEITVFTGKVEVGQNIRTSLTQVVAEELFLPVSSITMVMGDTQLTPYDRGTYGSLTTPQMAPILRKAAANLREMLLQQARQEWKLGEISLDMEQGMIQHPNNGKKLSYGDLAKGKNLLQKMDEDVPTIEPSKWKISGTSVPKVNGRDFITGKHRYVSDMVLPEMLYGKVLRPPVQGAKLKRANTDKAASLPGVQVVRDGDFIGVAAKNSRTAAMALASIEADWERSPQVSRDQLFDHLVSSAEKGETINPQVSRAYEEAAHKIEQDFEVQYIAHVPLEPRAGLAQWTGDKLEVWTGTQRPFGVQEELERAFNLPGEQIRVYMPDTGSGYGGKHTGEAGIEAAILSKATGKPVKVNWTREEEFKWAYFRPAGFIRVKGAASEQGITSWEFHNYNSGGAGIDLPYKGSNKHQEYHRSDTPLRQGSYRALASTANIFAMESTINDLAGKLGADPLQFRLNNLDNDRLEAVIKAAAGEFGWKRTKINENHGFGMACGAVKGGFVATFAEISVHPESRELKIIKAVTSFECGAIINPRHLESQVTGCVLQGLGGALFESVDFKDGDISNAFLSSYRVPRFKDVPDMRVKLVNRKDLPSSGAGEAPIVCIAPAIRNAIDDAVGVKINRLPMLPSGIVPKG
ncbi:molybdopterin cofactor-binding domain-containing protein [Cyclobacterium plantarum]|uniref:xanthine dehydrogenase family protein molybdopterin-binding subunit n=1 Tax=Cyclobacterium plantarum TaxID=2716263 RepID=UPI003F722420